MRNHCASILIVTSSYPPEIRSSSHLMQELAEELAIRGHDVAVATTYPSMNLAGNLLPKHYPEFSCENSVNVIRIKTGLHPHLKGNFFQRGISQLILPYVFFSRIKKFVRKKIDVVIVYSPPLTLSITGTKIKRKYDAKFILNVQDIFPQNAVDLGIIKNPVIIKTFENIEKAAYRNADVITVHSEGNRELLTKRKDFPADKAIILYNWVTSEKPEKSARSNYFRKRLNLVGSFIFFFGGVMGPSQGLDLIIKAAKELEHIHSIKFLLAGDGLEKQRLEILAKQFELKNVIFHPFVSKVDYPRLLKEMDVGLICLSPKNRTPVVPGKLLGYMIESLPVVAFLNEESDGHQIIREARCGLSTVSDDVSKAASLLLNIYEDRDNLARYGRSGHHYAAQFFSKKVCIDKIENSFQ